MLMSRAWLADFVALDDDLDDNTLAHDLTLHTVEVEGFTSLSVGLERSFVARVLTAAPSGPDRTALHLDIGVDTVELVAPIADASAIVAVAVCEDTKGWVLADPRQLGVSPFIEDVPFIAFWRGDPEVKPGVSLAAAVGWNDTVFEIDNKSLTNRPDLWGHLGIARELAAIYRLKLRDLPAVRDTVMAPPGSLIDGVEASVCSRFSVMRVEYQGTPPRSPLWMRSRLAKVGQRPINLHADVTNYVMFAVGQPCHAYDASTLVLPLSVMTAPGAELAVLGDGHVTVNLDAPVIADAAGPIALAGVIGGRDSAVSPATRNVIYEIGTFDPQAVRRSALASGIRTEASARFEKGLDTQSVDRAWAALFQILDSVDVPRATVERSDVTIRATERAQVRTTAAFLNSRMGTDLSLQSIKELLGPLGLEVTEAGDHLVVDAPTWRSTGDIGIPNDVLEELARIIGYDNLPPAKPFVQLRTPSITPLLATQRRVREFLAFRVGAQEVITYPWVSNRLLRACGMNDLPTVQIEAAAGEDRSTLRPSLLPNLLGAIEVNLVDYSTFAIFEVGTTYHPSTRTAPPDQELLSDLRHRVTAVFVGASQESTLRRAVGAVTGLGRAAQATDLRLAEGREGWGDPAASRDIVGPVGVVGRVASVDISGLRHSGGGVTCAAFELTLDDLDIAASRNNVYTPVSSYPSATIDVSVRVPESIRWAAIARALDDGVAHLTQVSYKGEYRSKEIGTGWKSITLQARLQSYERTLEATDKEETRLAILERLRTAVGATHRP